MQQSGKTDTENDPIQFVFSEADISSKLLSIIAPVIIANTGQRQRSGAAAMTAEETGPVSESTNRGNN